MARSCLARQVHRSDAPAALTRRRERAATVACPPEEGKMALRFLPAPLSGACNLLPRFRQPTLLGIIAPRFSLPSRAAAPGLPSFGPASLPPGRIRAGP